ncbi:MAG: hypothetical protein ABIL02_00500 [candidate division WOR-3 bacterium]
MRIFLRFKWAIEDLFYNLNDIFLNIDKNTINMKRTLWFTVFIIGQILIFLLFFFISKHKVFTFILFGRLKIVPYWIVLLICLILFISFMYLYVDIAKDAKYYYKKIIERESYDIKIIINIKRIDWAKFGLFITKLKSYNFVGEIDFVKNIKEVSVKFKYSNRIRPIDFISVCNVIYKASVNYFGKDVDLLVNGGILTIIDETCHEDTQKLSGEVVSE